jgi:PAS domain S-box-containing protein
MTWTLRPLCAGLGAALLAVLQQLQRLVERMLERGHPAGGGSTGAPRRRQGWPRLLTVAVQFAAAVGLLTIAGASAQQHDWLLTALFCVLGFGTMLAVLGWVLGEMEATLVARTAERQQAEDALRVSEERYRRIVETAQEGIWIIDQDNHTAFANQKMATMLGYSVDELIGRPLDEFLTDSACVVAGGERIPPCPGGTNRLDAELRRKDGTTFWAIVSTSAMFDRDASGIATLWMVTDITDRQRAEQERTPRGSGWRRATGSLPELPRRRASSWPR